MKLCIVAQPKTASTSLMQAVSDVTGLRAEKTFVEKNLGFLERVFYYANRKLEKVNVTHEILRTGPEKLRDKYPAEEYATLACFHSDVADFEISQSVFKSLFNCEIHKQHFPPTVNNFEMLEGVPKVVTIRDASETIDSYKRVPSLDINIKEKMKSSAFCDRLENELILWQEGWLSYASKNEDVLVVTKDDIVKNHLDVIREVCKYLMDNIEIPDGYILPRERVY